MKTQDSSRKPATEHGRASTWRNPFVWLVVGLPLSAVVASTITAIIAISGADPIVTTREPGRVLRDVDPMMPAQKARNRAAEARTDATAPQKP